MGLHRRVVARYAEWLRNVVSGALGYSTLYRRPVAQILKDRLQNTAVLAATAFAIIVPASIILGVVTGMQEASRIDRVISLASIITT
jgi:peptide/nickel transport system permease protein